MTIEERDQEVEEARAELDDLRWTTCLHCWRGAVDALIEAVRRQEKERAYIQGWNEGVRASGGSVLLELVHDERARSSEEAGG